MSLYQEALEEFRRLFERAGASPDPEPGAMNLATTDASGGVHSRIVLLKGFDEAGFRFYTNYESAKARELAECPRAALCMHWKHLDDGIQVRIEGRVERTDAETSDRYFATRARLSQIGAWASLQSRTLPSREAFEARIAEVEQRYAGVDVPRPPHWGGYRLAPDVIEFWYGASFRLHERVRYERTGGEWARRMLFP
jgi:pyridoxamine 5'-phosphate oxidase